MFQDFPRQAGLDAQELPGEHRLHKVVSRVGQLQAACLTKIKFRNQIIVESGKPIPDSFY
ncbi:hypothetical protein AA988_08565 [Enterococcus cecorum]|nr:hypothetical protein AA988_08565 [Enterococcus cecorum]